jgi:hypothetical protein
MSFDLPFQFSFSSPAASGTLLNMIRRISRRVINQTPSVVATATDATTLLLLELAQEEGEQLARFGDWRALRSEKTFTTVAAETQTDTPIPTDWAGFIDDTFWNRSRRMRLYGPATAEEWQRWKAGSTFPVTGTFYFRGSSLLIQPTPTAGDTVAYEYRSSCWCQSSTGVAQDSWLADTDVGRLDTRLMGLGVIWRYRQNRGLDWQTDFDKYQFEVEQALSKDQPRKVIDMKETGMQSRIPGLVIPEGSWSL